MKILVVDDNDNSRIILEKTLESGWHTVEVATNGEEALGVARESPPDMIISDILMPVMDGFSLCRAWTRDDRLKEIPFVFYTATYTDSRDEELALSLGAYRFIVKPIEPDKFIKIIQGVIRDMEKGEIKPGTQALEGEGEVLKLYSERLVKKLEKKMLDLEKEINERKQAEEIMKAVSRASPVGIGLLVERKMDWANETMYRISGYEQGSLFGKNTRVLYPDDGEYERAVREINAGIEESGTGEVETRWVRKDGTVFDCSIRACSLNPEEPSRGQIVAVSDISEAKRVKDQLQHAQKMEAIGTLAGGIAHDFNNILGAIMGYSELIKMKLPEESDLIPDLDQVIQSGKRAKNLVQQILTVGRQQRQEQRPVQIRYIIGEALNLLKATLPSTIEIREELAKDAGIVNADPTQVHQVIMNLCTNAGQSMEEDGGVMEVSLQNADFGMRNADSKAEENRLQISSYEAVSFGLEPGHYLRLTVSDTGSGMTPQVLEKIFDPYFTTKEPGEGTGLGLSVVQGIVKGHGGTITAYSEPGEGATFHVYLPVILTEEREEKETEEPLPTGSERILFIDDEEVLAGIGGRMLEQLGYEVVTRQSSMEALELFRAEPDRFDLVITDMTMPEMTGDKLARELMEIRPDIPIILCTGHSKRISEEKAKDMGIRAFVMKPIGMRDMANTVREVLDAG